MAYAFHNGHCRQCGEFVPAGPDTSKRLYVKADNKGPEGWDTFCIPCAFARIPNQRKAAKKTVYKKKQPKLFD